MFLFPHIITIPDHYLIYFVSGFDATECLASGNSKTIPMGFYLMILSHYASGIDTNRKSLEYCPLQNTLRALLFECNLEFTKDLDHNLYLPNIC